MPWTQFSGHLLLVVVIGLVLSLWSWIISAMALCVIACIYVLSQKPEHWQLAVMLVVISAALVRTVDMPRTRSTCTLPKSSEWISQIRTNATEKIYQRLEGDAGALLAGTLYGERGLSHERKQAFRTAGMTHLIAVSGSNLSILASVLFSALTFFHLKRRKTFVLLCLSLALYIVFVGLQAPVLRAGVMAVLMHAATLFGRKAYGPRILLISGVLFLAVQPCALFYDAGFALSFLATIGLMTYGKRINQLLEPHMPYKTLRGLIAETAGATLMTMPYSLWSFHQLSLIGLLSNILAVPLVGWAMALGTACVLLPVWSHACVPAKGVLELMISIGDYSSRLPFGHWKEIQISVATALLIAVIVSYGAWQCHSTHDRADTKEHSR